MESELTEISNALAELVAGERVPEDGMQAILPLCERLFPHPDWVEVRSLDFAWLDLGLSGYLAFHSRFYLSNPLTAGLVFRWVADEQVGGQDPGNEKSCPPEFALETGGAFLKDGVLGSGWTDNPDLRLDSRITHPVLVQLRRLLDKPGGLGRMPEASVGLSVTVLSGIRALRKLEPEYPGRAVKAFACIQGGHSLEL